MQLILTAVDESLANAWRRFCGDLDFVEIHQGSILDVHCDAIVSPANSFGFMDGGIDEIYRNHFGPGIEEKVRQIIAERHHGELLVGAADIIETGDNRTPFMVVAPTMRVPMVLTGSVNAFLAARAALLLVKHSAFPAGPNAGNPIAEKICRIAFPGLGTGIGQFGPNTCAHQFRAAIDHVLLGRSAPPRTWAEAAERHQLLYTDHLVRMQQGSLPN
jgi:O-acetyl-ADP-ribose deacetylase (regulator of RNase III)